MRHSKEVAKTSPVRLTLQRHLLPPFPEGLDQNEAAQNAKPRALQEAPFHRAGSVLHLTGRTATNHLTLRGWAWLHSGLLQAAGHHSARALDLGETKATGSN